VLGVVRCGIARKREQVVRAPSASNGKGEHHPG
jgi:hypothetical protein